MSSDQLPPPLANISFPRGGTELQFNYLDSFVTSWVTPESSQDPCFFSLTYWNDSSNGPWATSVYRNIPSASSFIFRVLLLILMADCDVKD